MSEVWRFRAANAVTGAWLHQDLPFHVDEVEQVLSGVGSFKVSLAPDDGRRLITETPFMFEPWQTVLYAEASGQIRAAGIVVDSYFEGAERTVETVSFSGYPVGQAFAGDFKSTGVEVADVVRMIWAHLQSYPDGDLGVEVVGSTGVKVGTVEEPYELSWVDSPDCGREIRALLDDAGADSVESHFWDGERVRHVIEIVPRAGRRRDDLAFEQGSNVVEIVAPRVEGDEYANAVLAVGSGEGDLAGRSEAAIRDGRLRRSVALPVKDVTDSTRLKRFASDELASRGLAVTLKEITVIDHANARVGSWQLGDEILVRADVPWLGRIEVWCRVTAWALLSEGRARLTLGRPNV